MLQRPVEFAHNADAHSLDRARGGSVPLKLELRQPKRSWLSMFGWLVVVAVLGLSWQSAAMRPLDLFSDSGNMVQFGTDFFLLDFSDWRTSR